MAFSTVASSSEDGRAFLQKRLALFGKSGGPARLEVSLVERGLSVVS